MHLIVGLGNPGAQYAETRHNVGFLFLDDLASRIQAGSPQSRFQGSFFRGRWESHELVLLKPETFMNLSGRSVRECMHFFKIPVDRVIVVFDDLDQEPGAVRMRVGGGHGGHNGIRSILAELGDDKFHRIKIGIGKPEHKGATVNWVLGKLTDSEMTALDTSFAVARERTLSVLRSASRS